MVCDLTGYRGGVYFEAGFASGLGLPVIYTCRKDWAKNQKLADKNGIVIEELKDEIMNSEPLDIPKISKQNLEYMGIPLTDKVEEFRLYITTKRAINQSEGKGEIDVQI